MILFADAPEMAELGLVEPLGNILSQLSQGGGARGINIDAVRPPSSAYGMPYLWFKASTPTGCAVQHASSLAGRLSHAHQAWPLTPGLHDGRSRSEASSHHYRQSPN